MGHLRFKNLLRTREWNEVLDLLDVGAGAPEVAASALRACLGGLVKAANDESVRHALWLVMRIPLAAREDDFAGAIRQLGLKVSAKPDLFEIAGALQEAVDVHARRTGGRTDLGEIARAAATEVLTSHGTERIGGLFEATPDDVRAAFHQLSTKKNFDALAGDLFSRITYRLLNHVLSRELPDRVGGHGRFLNIDEHVEFQTALETHSREAARIVTGFCGSFLSKSQYESGANKDDARRFLYAAIQKIAKELARGNPDV